MVKVLKKEVGEENREVFVWREKEDGKPYGRRFIVARKGLLKKRRRLL